jgi:hypothetical protein
MAFILSGVRIMTTTDVRKNPCSHCRR